MALLNSTRYPPAIHLNVALIIDPGNAEHDHTLGFDDALEKPCLLVFGMGFENGSSDSRTSVTAWMNSG